jgi:hypothetical protein
MSAELKHRVEALRLPRGQKAVLAAVAWFIWDSRGETDLKTTRQLATHADYGIRATNGHLATLVADGAIASAGRPGDPKGRRYRINLAWLEAMEGRGNPCKPCSEPLQKVQREGPEPLQKMQTKSPTSIPLQGKGGRAHAPEAPPVPSDHFENGEAEGAPPPDQPFVVPYDKPRPRLTSIDTFVMTPDCEAFALQHGLDPDDVLGSFTSRHHMRGKLSGDWGREWVEHCKHRAAAAAKDAAKLSPHEQLRRYVAARAAQADGGDPRGYTVTMLGVAP